MLPDEVFDLAREIVVRCHDLHVSRGNQPGNATLNGYFATGTHAGRDAAVLPQLVILDMNLPKISGLEVLRRIRMDDRTRLLPVVVLTSSKEDDDVLGSYTSGANACVRKPIGFVQFTDAVKTLSLFWLLLNEPAPRL